MRLRQEFKMQKNDNQKVYVFTCSPEIGELIDSMSKHVEGGEETLFQKSLILMGVAIKAKISEHKLVLMNKENEILDTINII